MRIPRTKRVRQKAKWLKKLMPGLSRSDLKFISRVWPLRTTVEFRAKVHADIAAGAYDGMRVVRLDLGRIACGGLA